MNKTLLLLSLGAFVSAASPELQIFDTQPGGQLYSPRGKLPGGSYAYTGNKLYFRSQPHLNGRVIYTVKTPGTVDSAVFGHLGEAFVISTPGTSQDVESFNVLKINVVTGQVIAQASTANVGMVTAFPRILEYNPEKDWIKVRGARSFIINEGIPSSKSEVYWLSLGKSGPKIEKVSPSSVHWNCVANTFWGKLPT